jgi:hypothetical protein
VLVDHLPLIFKASHERQHSLWAPRIIFYISSCPKLTRALTLKGRPFHKVLRSKSDRKRKTTRLFCKSWEHHVIENITPLLAAVIQKLTFSFAFWTIFGELRLLFWVSAWTRHHGEVSSHSGSWSLEHCFSTPIPFWCRCSVMNIVCSCPITAINSDFQCHGLVKWWVMSSSCTVHSWKDLPILPITKKPHLFWRC